MTTVKKKISTIQILRRIVQVLGLILLPGTFILAFSGIRDIYLSILAGNFSLYSSLPKAVEAFAVIPVTIIAGRFFCGWLCAFGTFNDFIYLISSKVFKIKFKISKEWDSALKSLKYLLLLFIGYFIWTKGSTLFQTASPWDAFAQFPQFSDAVTQYTIGSIILVAIIAGAMFVERFFCRYLCPLGAIFAVTSKLRIFDISKKRDKCGKCRACTNSCSMGISMYKHDKIKSGECINCFKCLDACPRKNTKAELLGEHVSPALAACLAIGGFTVLYSGTSFISKNIITPAAISSNAQGGVAVNNQPANNTTANTTNNSSNTDSVSNNISANRNSSSGSSVNSKYKDGTYSGTGMGFRPDLQVQVTIKSGKIKDIQITSSNDTPRFSDQAFAVVPNEIIQAQSTQVDAVSGATRSSNGVKQAVENALSKANM